MKIGILASEGSWYYRDLERAATALGHYCKRLEFARLVAQVQSASSDVTSVPTLTRLASEGSNKQQSLANDFTYDSSPPKARTELAFPAGSDSGSTPRQLSKFDLILVRTMPPGSLEQVVYRMDVLARLEASGIRVINSPKSLECAVDKYLTTARLQAAGLPVPDTIVCEHEDDAMEAFDLLGQDVVVKPLFGSEGRGIVRVTDPDLAHRTFRTLMRLNAVLYLQRFIDHEGFDVRILVLCGRVVGGMRRRSPNDFRTNVARAAIAESHQPTALETELALCATSTTGAMIAGVDLLYDRAGVAYVIEVNAVPGWQAFSRVTGVDVATKLIERLT